MTELLNSRQMRALEERAMRAGQVTGLALMERAGQGVVDALYTQWPDVDDGARQAAVLCGPGNNGGDGFVIARMLAARGWGVDVYLFGDAQRLPPDAATNHARWNADHPVTPLTEAALRSGYDAPAPTLYIDALFGIGLSRPLGGEVGKVVAYLAHFRADNDYHQPKIVAVDVPSGLDADSGRVLGCADPEPRCALAPYCDLTVTFDSPKSGHFLADGPALCGTLAVCDIGIGYDVRAIDEQDQTTATLRLRPPMPHGNARGASPASNLRVLSKAATWHKYSHGSALILSGGVGRGGAARLAARGALRIGAGLVTLGCPPSAVIENAAQLNAIMLRRIKDADSLAELLAKDSRMNAHAVGPGFGTGARELAILRAALLARRPCVLDADALTLLAQSTDLLPLLHKDCVLTPHAGEFARLFPKIADELRGPDRPKALDPTAEAGAVARHRKEMDRYRDACSAQRGPLYSKVDAVRDAAAQAGCVVLLKGPDTVVARPDRNAVICSAQYQRDTPWLATAGAGDVLAGFITGLLARGLDAFTAAELGAWLHQECALSFGPGLIAEDLPEELPKVFRQHGV